MTQEHKDLEPFFITEEIEKQMIAAGYLFEPPPRVCLPRTETAKPVRPRYTLDELLAQEDYSQPLSAEEREWIDAPPVGRELI